MRAPGLLPLLLLSLTALGACDTPGLAFRGLPATRVTVEGSTFDVRVGDGLAEAIRVNPEYAPRFGPIRERARLAMVAVSGCAVTRVGGDQAQATGVLDCGKGRRQRPASAPGGVLECVPLRGSALRGLGEVSFEVDCYPA